MTAQAQHRSEALEEMLLDAGLSQDAELRGALVSLGSFADLPVPDPGPELAALLAPPLDQLGRRRKLRRHRATAVGLAVVAGMGLGATGVAASSAPHRGAGSLSVQHLLEDWAPSWSIAPPLTSGAADSGPSAAQSSPEPTAVQGESAVAEPAAANDHEESAVSDGGAAEESVPGSGTVRHKKSSSVEEPGNAPKHAAPERAAPERAAPERAAQEAADGRNTGGTGPRSPGTAPMQGSAAQAAEAAKGATKNGDAHEGVPVLPWLKKADR